MWLRQTRGLCLGCFRIELMLELNRMAERSQLMENDIESSIANVGLARKGKRSRRRRRWRRKRRRSLGRRSPSAKRYRRGSICAGHPKSILLTSRISISNRSAAIGLTSISDSSLQVLQFASPTVVQVRSSR